MFNVNNDIANLVPSEVYQYLSTSNLSQTDIATFLGNYLLETAGRKKRVFNYKQAFPSSDPDCAANFTRSFEHEDWIDGESVVQAQQTTGELGFNERFHLIENDLDTLGANMATAFVCLSEMRFSLEKLLQEIRTELNRINADIFDLQPKTASPGISVIPGIMDTIAMGNLIGMTKFLDKEYYVYEMQDRIQMMPFVNPPDEVINPIERVDYLTGLGHVAKVIEENPELVGLLDSGRFTKGLLVERFGDMVVAENVTLKDALRTLPDSLQIGSSRQLIDEMSDRAAASIRISSHSGAVAAYFGVGSDVGFISDASVRKMNLTPQVTNALEQQGVGTVGALSQVDNRELTAMLNESGIRVTSGDVAAWQATARALGQIR